MLADLTPARQILTIVLCLMISMPSKSGASVSYSASTVQEQTDSTVIAIDQQNGSAIGITQKEIATVQDFDATLAAIPETSASDVLISTDSPDVARSAAAWGDKRPEEKKPKFILYGQLLTDTPAHKFARSLGRVGKSILEAAKSDKIGLIITVVSTGIDSYIWIHSQTLGLQQTTTMVLFNVILAASFGLNKDLWSKMARPIEGKLVSVLSRFKLITEDTKITAPSRVATRFFANVALSLGVQLARMSVLSLDGLVHAMGTPSFWITTGAVGTLLTWSGFGWSEHLADTDAVKNPAAKFILRRGMELRTVLLSYVAPSAKILQFDTYGAGPLIALLVNGGIGLAAMIYAGPLNAFMEKASAVVGRKVKVWVGDQGLLEGMILANAETTRDWRNRFIEIFNLQTPAAVRCENVF